jgi:[ribosomal protein S5]-alanine N-acetyltransferase
VKIRPPTTASDGVVRLRALRPEDAAAYARAFVDDPELARRRGLARAPDEAQFLADLAVGDADDFAELAISGAGGEALLGSVILHSVEWRHRRGELGYWLVPAARGRGVAQRALALTLAWMFEELGLERAELATETDNEPSLRLARRLGFVEEGVLRGRDLEASRRVDVAVYGLLRADWRRSRSSAIPSSRI